MGKHKHGRKDAEPQAEPQQAPVDAAPAQPPTAFQRVRTFVASTPGQTTLRVGETLLAGTLLMGTVQAVKDRDPKEAIPLGIATTAVVGNAGRRQWRESTDTEKVGAERDRLRAQVTTLEDDIVARRAHYKKRQGKWKVKKTQLQADVARHVALEAQFDEAFDGGFNTYAKAVQDSLNQATTAADALSTAACTGTRVVEIASDGRGGFGVQGSDTRPRGKGKHNSRQ